MYTRWQYMMVQIPSILRYSSMQNWISGRFEKFVWWASGAPVITENQNKKWDFGIVSIFPGWRGSTDNSTLIAQMPRNEVLVRLKNRALDATKKWGEYTVCE
jgi:hypothetical protein